MYGSIFHLKPKPGKRDAVVELWDSWERTRAPRVQGGVMSVLFQSVTDPDQLTAVAVFDSRESYFANAEDPEQDRWYRDLVELLEEEPVFNDGLVLRSLLLDRPVESSTVRGL